MQLKYLDSKEGISWIFAIQWTLLGGGRKPQFEETPCNLAGFTSYFSYFFIIRYRVKKNVNTSIAMTYKRNFMIMFVILS